MLLAGGAIHDGTPAEPVGTCAAHPDRPATPCARCGTFGCEACLRPVRWDRVCEPCVRAQLAALPALEGRARAVRVALAVDAVALLGGVLAALVDVPDGSVPAQLALVGLALATALGLLATPPLFLGWLHLAVRRGLAVGLPVGATPWEAVWSWVIPLVNLVKPFEIARRLGPRAPVTAWQACVIVGFLGRGVARQAQLPLVRLVPTLVLLAAALLAARVVRETTSGLATVPPREPLRS